MTEQKPKYLIHEHSRYTSAIDKYWVFENKEDALETYEEVICQLEFLDRDYYEEVHADLETSSKFDLNTVKQQLLNNEDDVCVMLTDGDYIVFSELNSDGFGRRP